MQPICGLDANPTTAISPSELELHCSSFSPNSTRMPFCDTSLIVIMPPALTINKHYNLAVFISVSDQPQNKMELCLWHSRTQKRKCMNTLLNSYKKHTKASYAQRATGAHTYPYTSDYVNSA